MCDWEGLSGPVWRGRDTLARVGICRVGRGRPSMLGLVCGCSHDRGCRGVVMGCGCRGVVMGCGCLGCGCLGCGCLVVDAMGECLDEC